MLVIQQNFPAVWSSISIFSSQRKIFSANNIFAIVTPVCNSTLKIAQMKMLFITMIMVMIMIRIARRISMRKLINPNKFWIYHYTMICIFVLWYNNQVSLFCANNWKRCCRRWYFWSLPSLYHQGQKVLSRTVLETSLLKKSKDQFSTLSARMSKHLMRFMATMLILMMILNWTLTFTKCWLEKQVAKIFLLFAVWNFKSCNTLWAIIR